MPTATTPRAVLRALEQDAQTRVEAGEKPLVALGDLIDALPLAVLVADDHGRYVLANAHATRLTGYSDRELRRLFVWDLTPGPAKRDFEVLWRVFIQQGEQRGRYTLVTKTGRTITTDYAARSNLLARLHVSVLRFPTSRPRKDVRAADTHPTRTRSKPRVVGSRHSRRKSRR